ncbi:MAG: hypothetical protein MJ252_30615, partial [archaeon]|nr:hypothetical protein [archaeon]
MGNSACGNGCRKNKEEGDLNLILTDRPKEESEDNNSIIEEDKDNSIKEKEEENKEKESNLEKEFNDEEIKNNPSKLRSVRRIQDTFREHMADKKVTQRKGEIEEELRKKVEDKYNFITEEELNQRIPNEFKEIIKENNLEEDIKKYKNEEKEKYLIHLPPVEFTDKTIYYGSWNPKGRKEGFGKFLTENNIYIGNFENDQFNGKGILIDENGNYYNGDFSNELAEGKGEIFVK